MRAVQEITKIKNDVTRLVQKHLKDPTASSLLLQKLTENKTFKTLEEELDHLAAVIEMARQIFIVNKINDDELRVCKNNATNLQFYMDEMGIYNPAPVSSNPNPIAPQGLTPKQKSQVKNISVVYVNGSRLNPFGHALLFLGKEVGYAQIERSKRFPYFKGYPQFMSADEFNFYLKQQRKHIIAVQHVNMAGGNLTRAVDKLDELLQKPWTWMGFRRNCLSFCKDVLRAGGYDCADLGDKKVIKKGMSGVSQQGRRPLPLKRLKEVNPAQFNHRLAVGLQSAGAERLRKAANTIDSYQRQSNPAHRPDMKKVYASVKRYIEPKDRKRWQWRIDWSFVWNFYSYVFNSTLKTDDLLIRSKIAILKKLRDFEFNILENNFVNQRVFVHADLKNVFEELKNFGYTVAQVTAVIRLKRYIISREENRADPIANHNIKIAESAISHILSNSQKSVAGTLEGFSIDEIKQGQGILARHDIRPSELVELLMDLKQEDSPGTEIPMPMFVH